MKVMAREGMRFLEEEVAWAESLTPALFHDVVSNTCPRFPDDRSLALYNRMRGFVAREAWLSAIECLVEIRLPHWRIRGIICEDGRWTCTICLRWLPASWQNTVCRGEHAVFELALLAAYLETIEHAAAIEARLDNVRPIRLARPQPITISSRSR
jgi:hypothetical protein